MISACQISACERFLNCGKRPDERKRRRPRALVIEQGMHPHPGPSIYDCGFDDSDGGEWGEDELNQSDFDGDDEWDERLVAAGTDPMELTGLALRS